MRLRGCEAANFGNVSASAFRSPVMNGQVAYIEQSVASITPSSTVSLVVASTIAYLGQAVTSVARTFTTYSTSFILYIGKQIVGAGAEALRIFQSIALALRISI